MSANQTTRTLVLLLGTVCALSPKVAFAEDLIVFEAINSVYSPGDVVDGAQVLKLDTDQSVSLITPDGKIIKIKGPYEQLPFTSNGGRGAGVIDALKGLVEPGTSDTQSLGVTRDAFSADESLMGGSGSKLPEPWLIDVKVSGDWCVRQNDAVVFWRADDTNDAMFKITTLDRGWQVETTWPAGYAKLASPPDTPIRDAESFSIQMNGKNSMIYLHVLPNSLEQPKALAAWMSQKNCTSQAKVLLSSVDQ